MEMEWKETYAILKKKHDEVIKTIELGKHNEEKANKEMALINYKLSIALIDEALATPVALPDDPDDELDDTWQLGLKIVKVLKRTRGEVLHRITILSPSTSQSNDSTRDTMPLEQPNCATKRPRTFMELAEALQNLEFNCDDPKALPSVLELLFSCEGVRLYHINVNGEVTTTDDSSTLRIVRLDQDVNQHFDATYFMQIIRSSAAEEIQQGFDDAEDNEAELDNTIENDDDLDEIPSAKKVRENTPTKAIDSSLIYPLVPAVSPCFRTEFGAFIFPDIQSDEQGAAIGIVVPKSTDAIVHEILESILHGIVRQKEEEDEDESDEEGKLKRKRRYASERVSDNIVQGACFISNGLVKGTEQLGKLVSYTTPYIISKMARAPENAPVVSNKVANSIEIAKSTTGVLVGVTGYLAGKVGSASVALGKFIAPHVHAQGSKILSNTMGYSTDEAKDKMSGVLTVAAGAVEGFGTIYNGLETSAGILGRNLSDNSVQIIEYKYGAHAGNLAHDTFDTVGNMINLSQNMSLITPKGLAKKTAKGTGKAIIGDFRPQVPKTNYVTAGSLYPDLTEFSKKLTESNN